MFHTADGREAGARLRRALEELGLTYLKFGRFLAMRLDILPEDVQRELDRLFEDIAPMPFPEARRSSRRNSAHRSSSLTRTSRSGRLQPRLWRKFTRLAELMGSASGKVQRSGIEQIFQSDMRILRRLAAVVDSLHLAGKLSVSRIAGDFQTWTSREFTSDTKRAAADRIRKRATRELIPKVYSDLTSSKVITMEFIDGVSLARIIELAAQRKSGKSLNCFLVGHGKDRRRSRLCEASSALHFRRLSQANPHPGNILGARDNRAAVRRFRYCRRVHPTPAARIAGAY